MKKVLCTLAVFLILILCGCQKNVYNGNTNSELDKHNLEKIILSKISSTSNDSLFAIALNKESKEVLLKYEISEDGDSIKILEVMDYKLNFSYKNLLKKLDEINDKEFKNAIISISNTANKIEIIENAKIKEVLNIGNKFNALAFYYDVDGITNKLIITYDLGDYYIANETTREIYFPIYISYSDFS